MKLLQDHAYTIEELIVLFPSLQNENDLLEACVAGIISMTGLEAISMNKKQKEFKQKEEAVLKIHSRKITKQERDPHKNGTIRTEYFTSIYVDKIRRKITAKSYEEIIFKLYEVYYPPVINKIPTVEEAFEQWMAERENDKSVEALTLRHNRTDWNKYWAGKSICSSTDSNQKISFQRAPFLDKPITDVKVSEIVKHYKYIVGDQNVTKSQFENLKSVINGAFGRAYNNDIPCITTKEINCRDIVKRCRNVDNSEDVWTPEERSKLFSYLETLGDTVYPLATRLCLCLGVRIGELRALTWEDYNPERKILRIRHMMAGRPNGKTNRADTDVNYLKKRSKSGERDLPVSSYAANVIEKLRIINGDKKYIINSSGDKPIPVNGFNEHLKKYCLEAGVRAFSSHKARFYVATSLFDSGLNDFQIARYLGHSDTSTSHIYDRRSKEIKLDPTLLETCMGKGEK